MNVLINAHEVCTDVPRGIEHYALNLIKALLQRAQNKYALAYFDKDGVKGNSRYIERYFSGFTVPRYECRNLHYYNVRSQDAYRNKTYLEYVKAHADVVHFPCHINAPNRVGAQLIVTIHDLIPMLFPEHFSHDWRFVSEFDLSLLRLLKADATIITDAHSTKEDICYYLPVNPERVFVIPLAYDENNFKPEISADTLNKFNITKPYMLYVGAVDIRKNIHGILDAFDIVHRKMNDASLVIAGNCETKELMDRLQSERSDGHVIYTGYVNSDERRHLMSSAAAFVFPTFYEGFGLPVLEAMACGSPVITSNVSSLPEISGDAAILVDPNNIEQLANEMERLLHSESLRQELIAKGFENCKRFSWDKTAAMTEEVYKFAYERTR